MRKLMVTGLIAGLFFGSTASAEEETPTLDKLLAENTYAISLQDKTLSGPGFDHIMEEAKNSQFVLVGEEHFNFYIPDITTGLFKALQDQEGYDYLMVEMDPAAMELISRAPLKGDLGAINNYAQTYPKAVTFASDQELIMLADIGAMSDPIADVIWGCDQAFGVTHNLDLLAAEVDDPAALTAIAALREEAWAKEFNRDFGGNGHFMADIAPEKVADLKAAVNAEPGSYAEWLLHIMEESNKIYGYYKNGQAGKLPGYFENNRYREEHLKDLCMAKYRDAEADGERPKAVIKFGSWHLFQGLSPTRMHTIGDFFINVANFNDLGALNIYFVSRPEGADETTSRVAFLWPFIKDLDPGEFAVIDLRTFREYPHRTFIRETQGEEWVDTNGIALDRLIYGYDMIFFTGDTKPATFEVVPEK